MNTVHILAAYALLISVAALPANSKESSDLSPYLDEGDHETLEPQSPAVDFLSLIDGDAGFVKDLEDTDLSVASESTRDSRSPHPKKAKKSKKSKSKG